MEHDALAAHARDEIGISHKVTAQPAQAASIKNGSRFSFLLASSMALNGQTCAQILHWAQRSELSTAVIASTSWRTMSRGIRNCGRQVVTMPPGSLRASRTQAP